MTKEQYNYLTNRYPQNWRKSYSVNWCTAIDDEEDFDVCLYVLDEEGNRILEKISKDFLYLEQLLLKFFELEKPKFIIQTVTEEDGISTVIVESEHKAFCRLFQYFNEDVLYINWIGVPQYSRSKGLGDTIMRIINDIVDQSDISKIKLAVLNDSWMSKWYEHLGFKFADSCSENEEYIWMEKIVKQKIEDNNGMQEDAEEIDETK